MSLFTSDRLLVACLFLGFGTAYIAVPALLQQVKNAARAPVPEPPPQPKTLQKDSENSLKIETLRTLANGFSYELRNSAFKIVASRVYRSTAREMLRRDLASRDYNRRQDAINAMKMLLNNNSLNDAMPGAFRGQNTVAAIVKALIKVLPQHERREKESHDSEDGVRPLPPSPVRPSHRPSQELALLFILGSILGKLGRTSWQYAEASDAALRAGVVTGWLAKYPFPCTLSENSSFNYKRSDVARLFDRMARWEDDPLMAEVIRLINVSPHGRRQMRSVGLSASSVRENVNVDQREREAWNWRSSSWADADDTDEDDNDVMMVNGEDTAGFLRVPDNITAWDEPTGRTTTRAGARFRSAERSQEEEHLRRRHREAIVVAERGAPLRRENILQREDSRTLQPMGGVSDVEGALNGLLGLSESRSEIAEEDEVPEHYPNLEADEVLDPVAEAEVTLELEALEARVQAEEAEERDRAQRRHLEMEQLIEEDPEIQGTSRATDQSIEGAGAS